MAHQTNRRKAVFLWAPKPMTFPQGDRIPAPFSARFPNEKLLSVFRAGAFNVYHFLFRTRRGRSKMRLTFWRTWIASCSEWYPVSRNTSTGVRSGSDRCSRRIRWARAWVQSAFSAYRYRPLRFSEPTWGRTAARSFYLARDGINERSRLKAWSVLVTILIYTTSDREK